MNKNYKDIALEAKKDMENKLGDKWNVTIFDTGHSAYVKASYKAINVYKYIEHKKDRIFYCEIFSDVLQEYVFYNEDKNIYKAIKGAYVKLERVLNSLNKTFSDFPSIIDEIKR